MMNKHTIASKLDRTLTVAAVLAGLSLPVHAAGFPETYGVGSRAMGLGNAFTAVADNAFGLYYNPAGLSQTQGHEISAEFMYTDPRLEVTRLDNGQELMTTDVRGYERSNPNESSFRGDLILPVTMIGAQLDVNRIAPGLPCNTQLGIIFSLPEKFESEYRQNDFPPDQPHLIRYGDNISHLVISAGVGVELVKDLVHVGVGTTGLLTNEGRFFIDELQDVVGTPTDVVTQCELGVSWSFWPNAGILVTPFDKHLKLGFSWTKAYETEMGPLPIYTEVDGGGIKITMPMMLDCNSFYTPEMLRYGVALDFEHFLLSFDVWHQEWSDYAYSTTDMFNYSASNSNIVAPIKENSSPNFEDTLNYGVGLELRPTKDLSLMVGYSYVPTPVPDQSWRVSNYIDGDRSIYSLGLAYTTHPSFLVMPLTVSGTVQYHDFKDFTVYKDGVKGLTAWDGPHGTTTGKNQTSYRVEGDVLAASVGVSMKW